MIGQPGHPTTDPKALLALWLYATIEGIGSARQLDRLCDEPDAYLMDRDFATRGDITELEQLAVRGVGKVLGVRLLFEITHNLLCWIPLQG